MKTQLNKIFKLITLFMMLAIFSCTSESLIVQEKDGESPDPDSLKITTKTGGGIDPNGSPEDNSSGMDPNGSSADKGSQMDPDGNLVEGDNNSEGGEQEAGMMIDEMGKK